MKKVLLNQVIKFFNKLVTKKVYFNNPLTILPISRKFGIDRGTPIDRYYIEKFLQENCSLIKGTVLEIASPYYTNKFGTNITKREILNYKESREATIIGDLTISETLPVETINCFICTQTFNFIYDIENAIKGASQVLKPGGVLLSTMAGISQISRYDMDRWGDYWRLTDASCEKLFSPYFSKVNIKVYGNMLSAISLLQGLSVEDLPDKNLLDIIDLDYQVIVTVMAVK